MAKYPVEPFRIKSVEPIHLITKEKRQAALEKAGYNIFNLRAEDVFIDFLTDSGTGAMSQAQWAAIMEGDESYAGARSYYRMADAMQKIFGFEFFVPTHQGRAAENILTSILLTPGMSVPSNMHFDTTMGNILARGCRPVNLVIDEAADPLSHHPFKGNMDIQKLRDFIVKTGPANIPFGSIVVTNNGGGGQPVSMENIRATAATYKEFGIPFFIDACRYAENSYFIKMREAGYAQKTPLEIAQEMFSLADGAWMSAKKDALVNIGGFLATRDAELHQKICNELVVREGFPTYGGLAGRDLDAIAVGLWEGLDESYLTYRIGQTAYFAESLQQVGVPILEPPGGHAVYLDARRFLPQIPQAEFPGVSLAVGLYLAGGIRACEIGSLMFAEPDPDTGKMVYPNLELVRLAIPRRIYMQSHFDYCVDILAELVKKPQSMRGMRLTYAPRLMRHFTAKMEQV